MYFNVPHCAGCIVGSRHNQIGFNTAPIEGRQWGGWIFGKTRRIARALPQIRLLPEHSWQKKYTFDGTEISFEIDSNEFRELFHRHRLTPSPEAARYSKSPI